MSYLYYMRTMSLVEANAVNVAGRIMLQINWPACTCWKHIGWRTLLYGVEKRQTLDTL